MLKKVHIAVMKKKDNERVKRYILFFEVSFITQF